MMYSSGLNRFVMTCVSYTTYPLKRSVPPMATARSKPRLKGMKMPTKPVIMRATSPPKSQGPRPVKSYYMKNEV